MIKHSLIFFLLFCAFLLVLLGVYSAVRDRINSRGRVRARLHAKGAGRIGSREELSLIREGRGLPPEGSGSLNALRTLIVQSGTTLGLSGVVSLAFFLAASAVTISSWVLGLSAILTATLAIVSGSVIPLALLVYLRNRRRQKFERQLPEAIDTIVRGLRAGHAVSIAIASVGQNLPDPAGAEFRITAAEMTYGLNLDTAMGNLYSRVGQSDLMLISLAVSIQSNTGGNLAEVLYNLSRVIRERFKLKRRAIALASEGRFSAYILSALPVALFAVLQFLAPGYYGEVWEMPEVTTILGVAVTWMVLGNYIIHRMVNIRV
jgi:tight adherence protein B